ncbi:hypothetical protein LTR50_003414 [Elasticomyces elasticus]|nr:hypothetical protein LTR50_003414 [Elasticomyces elasticus]
MLTSRVRHSTAGPSNQRPLTTVELPPYEPPTHPLSADALRALTSLLQNHPTKKLEERLKNAVALVSNSAAEVNDRFFLTEQTARKRKARREQQEIEAGSEDEQRQESLEKSRQEVDRMTTKLDESLRKVIDAQHYIASLETIVHSVAQQTTANTTLVLQATQQRRMRDLTQRGVDQDSDEEQNSSFAPTATTMQSQVQTAPPIEAFREKMERERTRYQQHPLAVRYAQNNDYRQFKRLVNDAKYPEGNVTLPHENTWFNEGTVPAPGITAQGGGDADSDDDLAIMTEKISTKCPLTLQDFREPLTSRKCPHTFEKAAILEMIGQSTVRVGGGSQARGRPPAGERAVQCPVPGCGNMLTAADLHSDAILLRKIKRLQNARTMEDEDDEADGRRQAQSVGSDDEGEDIEEMERRTQVRDVKLERLSNTVRGAQRVPAMVLAQQTPQGDAAMVDLGGDTDEDESEEE